MVLLKIRVLFDQNKAVFKHPIFIFPTQQMFRRECCHHLELIFLCIADNDDFVVETFVECGK